MHAQAMAADNPGDAGGGIVALFDGHRAELLRFLQARCGDPAEAEDLLQNLWLRLATVRPGPINHPRAYLFRMANNLAIDAARSRRRAMARDRHWLTDDGAGDGPPEELRDPAPSAAELSRRTEFHHCDGAWHARQLDGLLGRGDENGFAVQGRRGWTCPMPRWNVSGGPLSERYDMPRGRADPVCDKAATIERPRQRRADFHAPPHGMDASARGGRFDPDRDPECS
jgi:hypothetical protein